MSDHETAFVSAFIVLPRRERTGKLLANPKRRREALDRLNHARDLDLTCGEVIPPAGRSPAGVERLLREDGAGRTCYVIADGLEVGRQELPLLEALTLAAAHEWEVVLSCIPGRLAFHKDEAPGEWWILDRREP